MKSRRIHVDQGVSIYSRYHVWWIDVVRGGDRKRWNLHTESRERALAVARQLAGDILGGRWNVSVAGTTTLDKAIELYRNEYQSVHHCPATRKFTNIVLKKFYAFAMKRRGEPSRSTRSSARTSRPTSGCA